VFTVATVRIGDTPRLYDGGAVVGGVDGGGDDGGWLVRGGVDGRVGALVGCVLGGGGTTRVVPGFVGVCGMVDPAVLAAVLNGGAPARDGTATVPGGAVGSGGVGDGDALAELAEAVAEEGGAPGIGSSAGRCDPDAMTVAVPAATSRSSSGRLPASSQRRRRRPVSDGSDGGHPDRQPSVGAVASAAMASAAAARTRVRSETGSADAQPPPRISAGVATRRCCSEQVGQLSICRAICLRRSVVSRPSQDASCASSSGQ
jgi:hypothetical protein